MHRHLKPSLLLLLLTFILGSCASPVIYLGNSQFDKCETVQNIEIIDRAHLVFFGEIHGTVEAPQLFGEVVCAASQKGVVSVAIEWPTDLQIAVTRYIADSHSVSARASILAHAFWRTKLLDGKSSESMLRLLDRLGNMRSRGHLIEVHLFDDPVDSKAEATGRDRRLAQRLRMLLGQRPHKTQMLVLTGNLHSRVERGVPWNSEFEPAAFLLRDLQPLSLDMAFADGTAWTCLMDGSCAARKYRGNSTDRWPSLTLSPGLKNSHHGGFSVGPISASPPAVSRKASQ